MFQPNGTKFLLSALLAISVLAQDFPPDTTGTQPLGVPVRIETSYAFLEGTVLQRSERGILLSMPSTTVFIPSGDIVSESAVKAKGKSAAIPLLSGNPGRHQLGQKPMPRMAPPDPLPSPRVQDRRHSPFRIGLAFDYVPGYALTYRHEGRYGSLDDSMQGNSSSGYGGRLLLGYIPSRQGFLDRGLFGTLGMGYRSAPFTYRLPDSAKSKLTEITILDGMGSWQFSLTPYASPLRIAPFVGVEFTMTFLILREVKTAREPDGLPTPDAAFTGLAHTGVLINETLMLFGSRHILDAGGDDKSEIDMDKGWSFHVALLFRPSMLISGNRFMGGEK